MQDLYKIIEKIEQCKEKAKHLCKKKPGLLIKNINPRSYSSPRLSQLKCKSPTKHNRVRTKNKCRCANVHGSNQWSNLGSLSPNQKNERTTSWHDAHTTTMPNLAGGKIMGFHPENMYTCSRSHHHQQPLS